MSVWQSLLTTAAEVYEPRNWWGVVGLVIINGGGLLTAAGTVWLIVRQNRVKQVAEAVKAQVVHVHADKDPLRADVDKALAGIGRIEGQVDGLYKLFASSLETPQFDRRRGEDRRKADQPYSGPDRRSGHDRRK